MKTLFWHAGLKCALYLRLCHNPCGFFTICPTVCPLFRRLLFVVDEGTAFDSFQIGNLPPEDDRAGNRFLVWAPQLRVTADSGGHWQSVSAKMATLAHLLTRQVWVSPFLRLPSPPELPASQQTLLHSPRPDVSDRLKLSWRCILDCSKSGHKT